MLKGRVIMNDKQIKEITSRDEDFGKWYTDVCKKADLVDYSSVKGSMIIRPYGYAIWENMQKLLDKMFKETGHENVQMPMFIPESLLNIEKEHVEGFAPEVAWVTQGGSVKLDEKMCVRPTSEVLFCEHYSKIIKSYRDLPKLYNQWCTIVRWEKETRPFLRSREFLWQEGHTIHETKEEKENAISSLEIIRDGIAKNSNVSSTTQIRSTIDGMILDIPVKVGNSVIQANNFNDGTTIATIADMNDLIFKGKVDETEIGKIKEGMPISLTIGAMDSRTIDATLEYVSPKGVEENGAVQFEIKAALVVLRQLLTQSLRLLRRVHSLSSVVVTL